MAVVEIDDTSRERGLRIADLARLLSGAFAIQRKDGDEAAVRFLVDNGYQEPDARETVYMAKSRRGT